MGKRVSLSDLASEVQVPEARVPAFAAASRAVRLEVVAANPLNTRDLKNARAQEKMAEITASMKANGQLTSCAVVNHAAFVAIFPEHAAAVDGATYVQVNGARRRAAALELKLATLKVDVMDNLAATRRAFLSATASENLDRDDYDPIEEAHAVRLVVEECGSGKEAAEQLHRSTAWVSQRVNLLKLVLELQALVRSGELPLREARGLHALPVEEQVDAWNKRRAEITDASTEFTAVNQDDQNAGEADSSEPTDTSKKGSEPTSTPVPRQSAIGAAIKRLGGSPTEIAASLRSVLKADDIKVLVEALVAD